MDKELKAKWVAALRSGIYKQTKGTLRDDSGHCCLGVLLNVWGEGCWLATNKYSYDTGDMDGTIEVSGDLERLSRIILGEKSGEEGNLIVLNDGDKQTGEASQPFTVIADYIEANL